jgi:hypothetical protein
MILREPMALRCGVQRERRQALLRASSVGCGECACDVAVSCLTDDWECLVELCVADDGEAGAAEQHAQQHQKHQPCDARSGAEQRRFVNLRLSICSEGVCVCVCV